MGGTDLRIGIIGVGLMGADHAERVARRTANATLVAISDPDTDRAAALAERHDVRAIEDPLVLIAGDEIDAVIIASPGSVHERQVLACIERGLPALCEKPLTMDSASSLRVVQAERAAGRALIQVGFMRRFDPQYARMKELLDSGAYGRTLVLHNTHRNKSVPADFRSEMIVRDSLVHEVDVARFLFGQEISSIQVYSPAPSSLAPDGVIDPQVAVFRMVGGGLSVTEVFVNCQVGYEVRCEAVAERGTVTAGLSQGGLYTTGLPAAGSEGHWGGGIPADFTERFARAYDLEVQAWVDAVRAGDHVGPTSWDGYAATAVCTAGMQSLATGEAVEVELVDPDSLASAAHASAGRSAP